MATLMLKPEHGYVLLAAGAIAVEVRRRRRVVASLALTSARSPQSMWIGHSVMDVRARLFGKEFKEVRRAPERELQRLLTASSSASGRQGDVRGAQEGVRYARRSPREEGAHAGGPFLRRRQLKRHIL